MSTEVGKLDTHKSLGPDGTHTPALRELVDITAKTLSIPFETSWRPGEVPEDGRKANVTSVFKKGKEEDTGNYRPISLTSVSRDALKRAWLQVKGGHPLP